jgi:hypothetical protein
MAKHPNHHVETVARRLCLVEGLDPDQLVQHRYGDTFTAHDWESKPSDDPAVLGRIWESPLWKLYRSRAAAELSHYARKVKIEGNVVAFKRR